MSCQKSAPFPERSFFFFPLSQSVFVLAHWRNTSFHAPQQQCYPLRCEKQRRGNERDFPYRFLPGSASCKSCGHPKACTNPHVPGDLTGGTAALRSRQGRRLLSGSPGCGIWQGCRVLLPCGTKTFLLRDAAHQDHCSAGTKAPCLEALGHILLPEQSGDAAVALAISPSPAQRSEETGRVAPHKPPCFTEGQMRPAAKNPQGSRPAWRLLEGCGGAGCARSDARLRARGRCPPRCLRPLWLWKAAPLFAAPAPRGLQHRGSKKAAAWFSFTPRTWQRGERRQMGENGAERQVAAIYSLAALGDPEGSLGSGRQTDRKELG